ncbi:hypothetical protein Daura_50120 [Dactylosporangium aurantiacum]|uniref:Uncharacterized protein n=1 Tax=Dactylosporangium aurantiacum TaxID=35754 RepID=A0A9Q9MCY3_9ACTN|nr:hypothetical protein [Dactylosporangium aurantiacum]MDG6107366.1 hypothetical protein [Dactylosporangium aurantiacum]UWZ54503.1 hypothetical protein Daura_50120 [Dactylosporangium aurantiacum]
MSEYGDFSMGEQHEALDELHQVDAGQENYDSQFGVFQQDHAAAESTSFDQGHSVEFTGADGSHYAEQDFTSYDHSAAETDSVFAAEGSESYDASQFHELEALQARFDAGFAEGTYASN